MRVGNSNTASKEESEGPKKRGRKPKVRPDSMENIDGTNKSSENKQDKNGDSIVEADQSVSCPLVESEEN